MGWLNNFWGRSKQVSPGGDPLSARMQQALMAQKDTLRMEVLQEVRGQMNKVFSVVDNLKSQVQGLTNEKNTLASALHKVEQTLTQTSRRVEKLSKAMHENTARNAKGFKDVDRRLSEMSRLVEPNEAAANTASTASTANVVFQAPPKGNSP